MSLVPSVRWSTVHLWDVEPHLCPEVVPVDTGRHGCVAAPGCVRVTVVCVYIHSRVGRQSIGDCTRTSAWWTGDECVCVMTVCHRTGCVYGCVYACGRK